MPRQSDYGFISNPVNGLGIIRARTMLGNLRLWDMPRSEQALVLIIDEIGKSPLPGIYLLFDERSEKKVYIGQTENLETRLKTHMKTPEDKIKSWERAFIINDARNAAHSDLNDENIRLVLEDYLVRLFKLNRFQVETSASRQPGLSATQKTLCESFKEEINILLANKGKINKFIRHKQDDEIYLDDARKVLAQKGWQIQEWGAAYAVINNKKCIVRPGSEKPKGWQVTFRGSQSYAELKNGNGFLLMPRGKLLMIPIERIRLLVLSTTPDAFTHDTVDVFVQFGEEKISLIYKTGNIDITDCSVLPYP